MPNSRLNLVPRSVENLEVPGARLVFVLCHSSIPGLNGGSQLAGLGFVPVVGLYWLLPKVVIAEQ